jgi:hypothetical protein
MLKMAVGEFRSGENFLKQYMSSLQTPVSELVVLSVRQAVSLHHALSRYIHYTSQRYCRTAGVKFAMLITHLPFSLITGYPISPHRQSYRSAE